MIAYNQPSSGTITIGNRTIEQFSFGQNIDQKTVESFGEEWTVFHSFSEKEIIDIGDNYFDIVPEEFLNNRPYILDVGCGTGRWSYYISGKAGFVECIDPSKAVLSAAH